MLQIAIFDLTLCLLIASALLSLPWRGALRSLLQANQDFALSMMRRPQPVASRSQALRRGPHGHRGSPAAHPMPHHHRHVAREHAYRGHEPRP